MASDFGSIAHRVHTALNDSGNSAPLGHVHQLLAASLGYRSLAAYNASTVEATALATATHVVLDLIGLHERAMRLGYDDERFGSFVSVTRTMLYRAGEQGMAQRSAYRSLEDLRFSLFPFMWTELPLNERLLLEASRQRGEYADADTLFVEPSVRIDQAEHYWLWPVSGKVYLESKSGEPLWTGLDYEAEVRFQKVGRVCLNSPTLRVLSMHAVRLEQLRTEPVVEFDFDTDSGY